MAGSKSDFLENGILNHIFRGVAFPTIPATIYLALWIGDPTDAGSGGAEVSGGSYARVAIVRGTGVFDSPTNVSNAQKTANTGAITFPAPTGNWGTVTHFAVMDAITAGNMLYAGDLTVSRNILNGDGAPSFAAGALTTTES